MELNGREIRNIVCAAMAIAAGNDELLSHKHLGQVAKHIGKFKKALHEQDVLFRNRQNNN